MRAPKEHPEKILAGRIERGFDFRGHRFAPEGLSVAAKGHRAVRRRCDPALRAGAGGALRPLPAAEETGQAIQWGREFHWPVLGSRSGSIESREMAKLLDFQYLSIHFWRVYFLTVPKPTPSGFRDNARTLANISFHQLSETIFLTRDG